MTSVLVLPEAAAEIDQAIAYYERKQPELGLRFFEAYRETRNMIRDFPAIGSLSIHGTRRYLVKNFPYQIFYLEDDSHVLVIAVSHQKRRPDYWTDRL